MANEIVLLVSFMHYEAQGIFQLVNGKSPTVLHIILPDILVSLILNQVHVWFNLF